MKMDAMLTRNVCRLSEDGLANVQLEHGGAVGGGAVAGGGAGLLHHGDESADRQAMESAQALEAYFTAESRSREALDAAHRDGAEGDLGEGRGSKDGATEHVVEREEDGEKGGRRAPLGLDELGMLRETSHLRPDTPSDLKGLKLRLGLVPINPHAPPPPRLVSR